MLYYDTPPPAVVAVYEREKASLLDYEVRYRGYGASEIATRGWNWSDGGCVVCNDLKHRVYLSRLC